MDFPAAPKPARRVTFGAAAVLAGFLLLTWPPHFFLAPFVLLTLASRPRNARELFWLLATGGLLLLALTGPATLAITVIRASGLVFALFFVLQSLRAERPVLFRGLVAVLLTTLSLVIWLWTRGVGWAEVQQAFVRLLTDSYNAMLALARDDPKSREDMQNLLQPFFARIPDLGRAMPGILALQGLAGGALAWGWHHRIASVPLGSKPAPLSAFRFNDQLIWGAIFSLGLLLARLPDPGKAVAINLLVMWAGIYALRGLAVAAAVLAPAPAALRFATAVIALLLTPLALGLFLALGLADTWLDIRARLAPPASGGE